MTYTAEEVYNEHHAAMVMSASFSGLGADISTYLQSQDYSTRSNLVATFVQQYYVVAVPPPAVPSDFFGRGVTLHKIRMQTNQGSGPNPAVYINTVTSGRIAYVFLSSAVDIRKLKAAVDASFSGLIASGTLSGSTEDQDVVKNSKVQIFVLGGDSGAGARLIAAGLSGLGDWIRTGGTFSRQSPGAPIAFSTRYLRSDNRVAGAAFTTDYSKPTCVSNPEKIVSVKRSYEIHDDKDRGNGHRFLAYQGAVLLAGENWSGDDIVWRSSPPNYDGPLLPIKVPVSKCSSLRFRVEKTGQHGETNGYAWVTGVTDAGRTVTLVEREWFKLDDSAAQDFTTNCRIN